MNIAGTAALLVLLRRRLHRLDFARTVDTVLRITLAGALVAGVSYGCWRVLDDALGRPFWAQLVSLGTALAAAAAVYVGTCRALGVREVGALLALRSRFKRA